MLRKLLIELKQINYGGAVSKIRFQTTVESTTGITISYKSQGSYLEEQNAIDSAMSVMDGLLPLIRGDYLVKERFEAILNQPVATPSNEDVQSIPDNDDWSRPKKHKI